MSRALDGKVVAALKQGDHRPAYEAISLLFTAHRGPEPLELEILGRGQPVGEGAGQPYLRDGNAVGVPKLVLVQAFIVARQILQAHLQCPARAPEGDGELAAATAVLLFMDAEHLTAANTRKRILVTRLATSRDEVAAAALLDRERVFVDSLLTSRLHRHTKSPTLWSHRRWLVRRHVAAGLGVDVGRGLAVAMTAGERHPRNYYAWSHARFLVGLAGPTMPTDERRRVWDDVKRWCFAHHDDISGWSFLWHLADRGMTGTAGAAAATAAAAAAVAAGEDVDDNDDDNDALSTAVRETLGYAESLAWRNESVWWFLRTACARLPMSTEDEARLEQVHGTLMDGTDGKASEARAVLAKAWQWYESNRGTVVVQDDRSQPR